MEWIKKLPQRRERITTYNPTVIEYVDQGERDG